MFLMNPSRPLSIVRRPQRGGKMRSCVLFPALVAVAMLLSLGAIAAQAQSTYERYRFTTFAGNPPSIGSADGTGSAARFNYPHGVAVDNAGNIYVADSSNQTIRKVTSAGLVSTLAGSPGKSGSTDGNGSSARFYSPTGVAVDGAGNVYVADSGNDTIRKISPAREVSTLAGLPGVIGSADGTGSAARFTNPEGVAVDSAGNVYVADSGNETIRKINSAGVTMTLAGSAGNKGFSDGEGSAARFDSPYAVAVDSAGNVYVADSNNNTIRKITPAAVVSTFAGAPGGPGSADGTGSSARFQSPRAVAVDSAGNVYVCDSNNATIRKITPSAVVTTLAGSAGNVGSADGNGSAARFYLPYGVGADSAGNIYVGDIFNNAIRKISPAGLVNTLAGAADSPGSADGVGSAVRFSGPTAVAKDGAGNTYVADGENSTIRKITPDGVVTTFAGAPKIIGKADGPGSDARFNRPAGIAVDSKGNVFVSDSGRYNMAFGAGETIRKITPGGFVTTFAGDSSGPGYTDGVGTAARFNFPGGIAVDGADNLFIADTGNNVIRKITPAGVVTTLAGGTAGFADGTGSLANFFAPGAVAAASDGSIYVADTGNATIRKITLTGAVTTLAGYPRSAGTIDGIGSAARFNLGWSNGCYSLCGRFGESKITGGIAVDNAGNVYVGDTLNDTIRKITPAGVVTTVAGLAGAPGTSDGVGSAAHFNQPNGLFVDKEGRIFVADTGNNTIRVAAPISVPQSLNSSTRVLVESGENVLIGGFIITGSVPKKVALRAIGPSLAASGVKGTLADPMLELRDSSGALLGVNDNWKDASNASEVQAAGLAPANDLEAAFIATLAPNQAYTTIVRGVGTATGVALVEAYDLNPATDALLANISTRGFVETSDNVMIGGFILGGGTGGGKVIVRAIGPSLTQSGISNALVDPTLEMHNGDGATLAINDNWKDTQKADIQATGIPPTDDLESAIVATLPAGNYTAIVAGKGGTTGVALVEVYNLQ